MYGKRYKYLEHGKIESPVQLGVVYVFLVNTVVVPTREGTI